MPGTNAQIVHEAIARYRSEIFDTVEKRCRKFCSELCVSAIRYRELGGGHDFTGNLLNSIVVCLYRERRALIAYYAAQYAPEAIQMKMTSPGRYHFARDYSGVRSSYVGMVKTDEGFGVDDAREFFWYYVPPGRNLFDIVVAYPVEYGKWVEQHRSTTGILQSYAYAESVGVQFLKLVRK